MRENKPNYILIYAALLLAVFVMSSPSFGETVDEYYLANIATPTPTPSPLPTPTPLPTSTPTQTPTPTPEPTPTPLPPLYTFAPQAAESTQPDAMLNLSRSGIMVAGETVVEHSFNPPINFGFDEDYSLLEGITTFRGNNFRNSPSYGFANIKNGRISEVWSCSTGTLQNAAGTMWHGHGWTGQPLIVKWPIETRSIMGNMKEWARTQEELVEVIYAGMDGHVYFQELSTGKDTRDKLFLGWVFKGSGTLDPRGYPLLYVGAGDSSARGAARIFIVSLIDGSVLHTFGTSDSFAYRNWWAADSSPLIDAENDRLIYPSENGLVYIVDLNTDYNTAEGTISIDPVFTKWRYSGERSGTQKFWLGIETSIAAFRGFAYFADNGGHMICLNINTLEPVWVQDILDDSNSTPVFSVEDDKAYIYVSTSYHLGWRTPTSDSGVVVPIWKLDAETGEVVWQVDDYICGSVSGVSGGVQGTIAVGKRDLDDLIFVPIARTPTIGAGILAAISKSTGEIVWEFKTSEYSWTSPVCVYTEEGKGYIIYTAWTGHLYLIDGLTGERLDTVNLDGHVEASPAVFEDYIVIGTRGQRIKGIKLS